MDRMDEEFGKGYLLGNPKIVKKQKLHMAFNIQFM